MEWLITFAFLYASIKCFQDSYAECGALLLFAFLILLLVKLILALQDPKNKE